MGLLNYQHIIKSYGQRLLLNDVSFSVERGERLAMIGPNGSGKTTLVRIAMGLERADEGSASLARGVTAGYLTQDMSNLGDDENALHWGEIARLEEKLHAAEAELALSPDADALKRYEKLLARYEQLDGYVIESRLKAVLLGLGLRPEALETPLSKLSSGEKMRVALARILLREPDLLVFDEPTNHLDVKAVMWLEEYLKGFRGGVFVISHDRYFLDRIATRMIELKAGTVNEYHGNYSSFLKQREIREAFAQSERERLAREIKREREVATTLRSHRKIVQAKSREHNAERLAEQKTRLEAGMREAHLGKSDALTLRLRKSAHDSAEIACAKRATKRFGERVLFENAEFLIRGGEHVAFVGANGCGKTTLLRMMLGVDRDFTGVCRIGEWVHTGLLDQNSEFEHVERSLLEEIIAQREQSELEARGALARLGFYGDEVKKTIDVLSGGERVRLKLALLLQAEPQCLVLDEPTNHLDLPAREAVEAAVARFPGAVIAVSHDRYFLNRCVTRIYAFEDGALRAYEGNWDAYQASLRAPEPAQAAKKSAPAKARKAQTAEGGDGAARSKEAEALVQSLEAKKRELVSQMDERAPASLYAEYAALENELAEAYERWASLTA